MTFEKAIYIQLSFKLQSQYTFHNLVQSHRSSASPPTHKSQRTVTF